MFIVSAHRRFAPIDIEKARIRIARACRMTPHKEPEAAPGVTSKMRTLANYARFLTSALSDLGGFRPFAGRAELTGPVGSGHSPTSAEVAIDNLWRPVSITV
jgi:hypothetical protein